MGERQHPPANPAFSGPAVMIRANSFFWAGVSLGRCPGGFFVVSPSTRWAKNKCSHCRTASSENPCQRMKGPNGWKISWHFSSVGEFHFHRFWASHLRHEQLLRNLQNGGHCLDRHPISQGQNS
jgi:hypothetical protein